MQVVSRRRLLAAASVVVASGCASSPGPVFDGAATTEAPAAGDGVAPVAGQDAGDDAPGTDTVDWRGVNPLAGGSALTELRGDFLFAEGPAWFPAAGELLFSDTRALSGGVMVGAIWRLTPPETFEMFRMPTGRANGLAVAPDGALIACEVTARRVSRSLGAAAPVTVADRWPGGAGTPAGRLNAPNDVIAGRDGNIYFTDPDFSVAGPRELGFTGVYRVDPQGAISLVSKDLYRPNGIALSPDETTLYVDAETPPMMKARVHQFPVSRDGAAGPGVPFAELEGSAPDGMAVDVAGNLYVTTTAGIEVFAPDGKKWGVLAVPKEPSNCTFGDADGRSLYITANGRNGTGALYRARLDIPGFP